MSVTLLIKFIAAVTRNRPSATYGVSSFETKHNRNSRQIKNNCLIMWQLLLLTLLATRAFADAPEEAEGVKYANKCEVCKVVALELEARLNETGKTHDVLEIGYSVDDVVPKKKKEYRKSELRLVESLENVCDRILEYNIHKERGDSSRFSKGMSQTFKTLHGLVDKGVKVELGIPYELWDKPSVEITTLKTQCEDLLENHESDIEEWYYNLQGQTPLTRYLCSERALKNDDDACLKEKGDTGLSDKQKSKGKKKKKSKSPKNSKESAKNAKEDL